MQFSWFWKETTARWTVATLMAVAIAFVFKHGLVELERLWSHREEYSHAYFLPLISLFLVWQQKDELRKLPLQGSWAGLALVILGVVIGAAGSLSTIYLLVHYGFLITLVGAVLAYLGWQGLRLLWAPLLLLFFTIPLPPFLYQALSIKLQLVSSQLGVALIRLFGISVYLEGNVIDLGIYKLQVVDACSGLRYLFPLTSVGFLIAYFFKAPAWQRFLVFFVSIPLTIVMNSLRIAITGVLVKYWGTEMAEGFIHDFEGWIFFMVCTAILLGLAWLLSRLVPPRRPFRDSFGVELPAPVPKGAEFRPRAMPGSLYGAALALLLAAAATPFLESRQDIVVPRTSFYEFPALVGNWQGRQEKLEGVYLKALKLDDYLAADYTDDHGHLVNFWVAYYASQRSGESAHSPRSCLPGGGWEMDELSQRNLPDVLIDGRPLRVNRVQIQKGEAKQLVYYWFQQRGRVIDNEFLVKWYIFWDAMMQNRTDGALVRITTPVGPTEDWGQADERLTDFARQVSPVMNLFIPG